MEKAEKLKDAMLELQKQSVALEQKFNPAPAVPAQQAK
jgi:lipoprotein hlpB